MPDRVKCLHVLVGHSLAAGPGVNPLGDEALAMLPEWWRNGPCVQPLAAPDPADELPAEDVDPTAIRSTYFSYVPLLEDGFSRVAAIDCGTNSIRLLVADVNPATGELRELDRRMTIVRLGQGVDKTGKLAPEALERTFAACREYAEVIREKGADKVRFVATSASRDASNRDDFVRGVLDILGVEPEVITGDEEAELSFTGATMELTGHDDGTFAKPYLVVDIGGGSTEFVVGDDQVRAARSVDIGCVRMTERHLVRDGKVTDPPTPDQITAMRADIEAALDLAEKTVPLREARTLVGLAGSVTTVSAIAQNLPEYDTDAIHHSRVSYDRVREITESLLRSTHAERAAIPSMHPGRVDVIGAGALVLLSIMERVGATEVVVSEHDILDGIAFKAAEEAEAGKQPG
jgi:exopolyphosphatase/pppGpp-phosphohydrolase